MFDDEEVDSYTEQCLTSLKGEIDVKTIALSVGKRTIKCDTSRQSKKTAATVH